MKKIITGIIICGFIFSLVSCSNEKEKIEVKEEETISIQVLEERKVNILDEKDDYLEYDYKVKNVEINGTNLEIIVDAQINDFNTAYSLERYISNYIKENNTAKIDLYGVENESVIFKGEYNFLYDGSEIIKLIK